MTCSRILREQGKPYPRTCPVHGLLECPKPDFTPTAMDAVRAFVEWHEMDHENTPAEEIQAAYDVAISIAKQVLTAPLQESDK